MKRFDFSRARSNLLDWGQEEFASLRTSLLRPGRWGFPAKQPEKNNLSYGQTIIENTPPQKQRRNRMPFSPGLAVIIAAFITGWLLFWLWWNNLPRAY